MIEPPFPESGLLPQRFWSRGNVLWNLGPTKALPMQTAALLQQVFRVKVFAFSLSLFLFALPILQLVFALFAHGCQAASVHCFWPHRIMPYVDAPFGE